MNIVAVRKRMMRSQKRKENPGKALSRQAKYYSPEIKAGLSYYMILCEVIITLSNKLSSTHHASAI